MLMTPRRPLPPAVFSSVDKKTKNTTLWVVFFVKTEEILITQRRFDVGDNACICAKGLKQAEKSVCLRLCNRMGA